MKFFNLFIAVLLFSVCAFAQENPTCEAPIDTDFYCALSTELGTFCEDYVVVMETRANAKTLVRAKIVDSCTDCSTYHVDLSKEAFTTLTEGSEGQSDIIWAIFSADGELKRGPFYNVVDEVAESYGLTENSFVAAFKVLASRIAANGSSSGSFNVTRGQNTIIRKTATAEPEATPAVDGETVEVPISDIKAPVSEEVQADGENAELDGGNDDTIVYDENTGADVNAPKNNNQDYDDVIVMHHLKSSSVEDYREADGLETDDTQSGSPVGALAVLSCLGASGVGLVFLKKKNPTKYDELKKKFPEAFSSVKRRASELRRSVSNGKQSKVTLPSNTNNYMPADNIEDEEIPRITVYDNQDSAKRN